MESNNMKFPDDPSVTLTIRLIMQGKVSWICIRLLIFYWCGAFTFRQNENEIYSSIISNTSNRKSFIFMIFHEKFTSLFFRILFCDSRKSRNQQKLKQWIVDSINRELFEGFIGGKGSFTLGNIFKGQLTGKWCWIF